jgi:predicted lipase
MILSQSLCPKCRQVRVTGHSLGGAVATIAALGIQNITKLPVRLANYGSPRVGKIARR